MLLSSYLHNSIPFYQIRDRKTVWVCLLPKSSTLHEHERLLSKTINTVEHVRWKTSRLHSMLSRRSSSINTSFSGLVLLYTTLLLHLPKRVVMFCMSLLCPFFQNPRAIERWFFRFGTQNMERICLCAVCCFAPRLKKRLVVCSHVLRLG